MTNAEQKAIVLSLNKHRHAPIRTAMTPAEQQAIELLHGAGYAIATGTEYLQMRAIANAIPWQALLNITQRPGEAVDADMDDLTHFLNEHAPWS